MSRPLNLDELRENTLENLIPFALKYHLVQPSMEKDFRTIQYLRNKSVHSEVDQIQWQKATHGLSLTVKMEGQVRKMNIPYECPKQANWSEKLLFEELVPLYLVKKIWEICDSYYGSHKQVSKH